jgi:hypothetical protein
MKLHLSLGQRTSQDGQIIVTPAEAGVQNIKAPLDSGFRRNDKETKARAI